MHAHKSLEAAASDNFVFDSPPYLILQRPFAVSVHLPQFQASTDKAKLITYLNYTSCAPILAQSLFYLFDFI